MTDLRVDPRGFWLGVTAYVLWGLSPIYWNLLDRVPVIEILAHRVTWAVGFLLLIVAARGRFPALRREAGSIRTMGIAVLAALLLAANWGIFIWGVDANRVVEVSLGYFINPLLSVLLGVLVLRERLTRAQAVAVALAVCGVVYMTVRAGTLPWISLVLAVSFAVYGLLKKHPASAPALEGLALETSALVVPGLLWITVGFESGDAAFGSGAAVTMLLIGAGLVTIAPLLAFGESAKRIPLSTLGLLQYLAPSLQFLLGVFVYGEAVGADRLVGFIFVWCGLGLLSTEGYLLRRRPTRLGISSAS